METSRNFLNEVLSLMEEQTLRIEERLKRLSEEAIWKRPREDMSSIGNLCLHLAGNESHYIGCCIGHSDYERDREAEFATGGGVSRDELLEKLRSARDGTRAVFQNLSPADMYRSVATGGDEETTVVETLLRIAEHYGYHAGQIVLLTRLYE
jgi:uncharacterized damage-inducible protein DinB